MELIFGEATRDWELSKEPEDHTGGSRVCGLMSVDVCKFSLPSKFV